MFATVLLIVYILSIPVFYLAWTIIFHVVNERLDKLEDSYRMSSIDFKQGTEHNG